MMKKISLLLFGLLYGTFSSLFAENVSEENALKVATRFTQQIDDQPLEPSQSPVLAYSARPSLRTDAPNNYYYVFNRGNDNGYIIVAGDDRAYPILGYATKGHFLYEKIPDNMKRWLQEYAGQIQYAYTNVADPEVDVKKRWEALLTDDKLPLLTSKILLNTASWGQHSPFNNQCPMVNGQRAVTGSVATAMAIIMKYHKYPDQGTGSHSYTDVYGNSYSCGFETPYDWDRMLDDYSGDYTEDQKNAVAKLMYHCGVSCETNYDSDKSSTTLKKIAIALPEYFKYDKDKICRKTRKEHSEKDWASFIQTELDNDRPIAYGTTIEKVDYAFVLAGYNDDNQYYVNWGKVSDSSDYNGWFRLSALTLDKTLYNQDMVIGIKPPEKETFFYNVTWTDLSGVTVVPSSGFNSNQIASGGTFKFRIKHTTGKKVVVKNGTVILTPDLSGDYVLTNIRGNTFLTLSFETIVYQVILPTLPGFDIQAAPGYNASSVESGSDFKFTVIPYAVYENYTIRVSVNGVLLSSADGTTYIIEEVKKDQLVEVKIEIEEFPPIVSPTYRIISYVDTGAALIPANGYYANAVEEGNDFKFYVDLDYGYRNWEVTVKVDDAVLSSDSWGVYKISNIYSDKTVVITLSEVFTVTYVNAQEEIEVVAENGYNMDRVVAGSDFAFHLVSPYNEEVLAVYANGKRLVPSLSVYTIPNVQENQEITVQMIDVGNEKILSDDVRIEVDEKKICITHPYMENIPVYITSFSGALYAVYKLNGVYTELELPAKGSYIIYFGGFSQKIIVR